jgi:type III restriction enzyme
VKRKLKAAATWCECINELSSGQRSGLPWHYALVGESLFYDWQQKGARLSELLAFAKVRASLAPEAQSRLSLGD